VRHIASNLRDADRQELLAVRGEDADITDVLFDCVKLSDWTLTGYDGDEPICIFGVGPGLQHEQGSPWMLGTKGIERIPKTFLKISKQMIVKMHETYPLLTNFVLKANTVHLRYIKFLGFELGDEYEINGEPFIHFSRYQPHV